MKQESPSFSSGSVQIDSINYKSYTKEQFVESFKSVLCSIENPYIPHEDDFSTPQPEFFKNIKNLIFKIPMFNKFNQFFELVNKYITIDDFETVEKNFPLILNLSILKYNFKDLIHEKFYELFPEENKIVNCVLLDLKLRLKEGQEQKNKNKI